MHHQRSTPPWGMALAFFAVVLILANGAMAAPRLKVLHTFTGSPDGLDPNEEGPLTFDSAGNLYGTTAAGGTGTGCNIGCGTVFELTPTKGGWTENVLYSFSNENNSGYAPVSGVILDSSGNLYGTALFGGDGGCGILYQLTPASGGGWTENNLHTFVGGANDGCAPSGLSWDAAGNLYGVTTSGGPGPGTVFEITPNSGGGWNYSVIYFFGSVRGGDGSGPYGALVFDRAGDLYGTTYAGGTYYSGTVFKLTPSIDD